MAIIFEINDRKVIPNWRDFKRTLRLGELATSNSKFKPLSWDIQRSKIDWSLNKNLGTAADLINCAFVANINDGIELNEAIKFIHLNKEGSSSTLDQLIVKIQTRIKQVEPSTNKILEIDIDKIEQFRSLLKNDDFYKFIHKSKNRAKIELQNPIAWVELARLYSIRGQVKKAERSIKTALQLAPNNRFVLRSATRFFIHTQQFDKALHYLKNSGAVKIDPWLMSAHIATCSVIGRSSKLINPGKLLIESNNFSDFEVTELASAIATVELKSGSFKQSKRLFDKSLSNPNDNSLAQFEWATSVDDRLIFNPFEYKRVINPFEAFAQESYQKGDWSGAMEHIIDWFLDMPFSKSPIDLGYHIASSILDDQATATILCEAGLQANPNDVGLLNNIIYNAIISNDLDLLDKYINQFKTINFNELSSEQKIACQATFGLLLFRNGQIELGITLYKGSIKNAKILGNRYLQDLAILNFQRELLISNHEDKSLYLEYVLNLKLENEAFALKQVKNQIIQFLKQKESKEK